MCDQALPPLDMEDFKSDLLQGKVTSIDSHVKER
jgi:hypothetical protein